MAPASYPAKNGAMSASPFALSFMTSKMLFWVTGVLLGPSSVAAEIDRNSRRILRVKDSTCSKLIAESHGDCHQLRVDVLGGRIVIARLYVKPVWRLAHPDRETHAAIHTEGGRTRACDGRVTSYHVRCTCESPPKPRWITRRGGARRDRLREACVAVIPPYAADEIRSKSPTAQLVAIIPRKSKEIAVPANLGGLQSRSNLLESFVGGIK